MRIILDDETIKILKLQRTNLKDSDQLERDIGDEISLDYSILKDHIPVDTARWMDVGCGLGLVDVMLWNGLSEPKTCYLMDKSIVQEDKRLVGFGDLRSFGFYNNLAKTNEIMIANGVTGAVVLEPEAVRETVSAGTLDLVISRISWCFHYPYRTYGDLCHSLLKSGGVLIVDCRKKHLTEVKKDSRYKWTCIHETRKAYIMKGVKI